MRIEKSECNYRVTECDLKFGEQITLDGEPLIPISTLDKIKAEIESKEMVETTSEREFYNMALLDVLKIIDKYRKE